MHCTYHNIGFDLNKLMVEELPWTQAFYREMPKPESEADAEFYSDVKEYFAFPLEHSSHMPVYNLHLSSCAKIEVTFERAYAMLVEAVGKLFNESNETLMYYMGCDFLRKHPYFIDYAKFSYRDHGSARQAIYGRFDAAFDPVTEEVTGIYEFNGDTPTMLFESVSFQNQVCETVTGDNELQLNSFYPLLQTMIGDMGEIPGNAAVIHESNSFEDTATSEVIAQILGENNVCLFADVTEIDYDFNNKTNPFHIGENPLTVIFALVPWEEMVAAFPQAYKEWQNWASYTTMLEPAWRWFTSNKGIWAYIWRLLETDAAFAERYGDLPVIPTYVNERKFETDKVSYVKKPRVGRMSSNVEIFDAQGTTTHVTDGPYKGDDCVYQAYHAPHKVEGRNNFIIGMFMVPDVASDYNSMRESTAATMCIREFDAPTLSWKNERFIPHVLINDMPEEHEEEEDE